MSKTITIDSCVDCPQAKSNGIEPICSIKFINNVLPKNLIIPSWCPLPDSKPYKWKDFDEWELLTFRNEKITNRALFNAARERKEG